MGLITLILQTAPFSTSYNMVWTPEQVAMLYKTVSANTEQHVATAAIDVIRAAYQANKRRRLARAGRPDDEQRESAL